MMGCSFKGETEKERMYEGENSGILSGHAYGIIDVFELHDMEMQNPRQCHRILRIRNPWGQTESKLKWSD